MQGGRQRGGQDCGRGIERAVHARKPEAPQPASVLCVNDGTRCRFRNVPGPFASDAAGTRHERCRCKNCRVHSLVLGDIRFAGQCPSGRYPLSTLPRVESRLGRFATRRNAQRIPLSAFLQLHVNEKRTLRAGITVKKAPRHHCRGACSSDRRNRQRSASGTNGRSSGPV